MLFTLVVILNMNFPWILEALFHFIPFPIAWKLNFVLMLQFQDSILYERCRRQKVLKLYPHLQGRLKTEQGRCQDCYNWNYNVLKRSSFYLPSFLVIHWNPSWKAYYCLVGCFIRYLHRTGVIGAGNEVHNNTNTIKLLGHLGCSGTECLVSFITEECSPGAIRHFPSVFPFGWGKEEKWVIVPKVMPLYT